MGDMDDLVQAFKENTKTIVDEATKPLKDEIDNLVNSNQELVSSNQELVREVEKLRNKKSISANLLLELRSQNPNFSDQEIIDLAKKQTGVDL